MSVKPLAEAYEKLKELRRQADSGDDIASFLQRLEAVHEVATQRDAETVPIAAKEIPMPEGLIRTIEIRTLADRVFGDPGKADAWLKRPSATLSGQRPVDLLRDELGTAVVRELLERIDHGIFA
jgi:putative toxin-antitoxin system antitoxin component (TIGR02293 family)